MTQTPPPPIVQTVNQKLIRPFQDFLHKEATAGLLIVAAAIAALIWANSPFSDSYFDLWSTHAAIELGSFHIDLNLKEWVNDGAMALFFVVVGLEIKREITDGELQDPRQASLPIIAAIGGMIVPAAIYAFLNSGGDGADGWGIPMATDIAIVMGVVALLGSRAPSWLKLFLLALAIVDDIGAILVIAVFYSEGVSFTWLAVALGAFATAVVLSRWISAVTLFVALGVICWYALHEAHIHPTLAGVAFGMLAPVRPVRVPTLIDAEELHLSPDIHTVQRITREARDSVSVVEWLEYKLHPYSAFFVVPVFALANAGIKIPADEFGAAMTNSVTWGVVLGLVIGKTVGVSLATLAAVATGVGRLPAGVTKRYVIGAGALAGIGFTVSLFVTELAFGEAAVGTEARLGVLTASLAAAVIGTLVVLPGAVENDHSMDETRVGAK